MAEQQVGTAGIKHELHRKLRAARESVLSKLEGLSEYDLRRPMTPTGTNLLGLVKHLAGVEYAYLAESFDRPLAERMSWIDDGSIWDGADMWATQAESSEYLIGLYRRVCALGDRTIEDLDLDAPATVAHWSPERRSTTLGALMIRMVGETAQHAGHADIVRELIDGVAGADHDDFGGEAEWQRYVARIHDAAEAFRPKGR